jgi:hypothetical protein
MNILKFITIYNELIIYKEKGFFFRSTTSYALIGLIDTVHHRVRVRASKSVGAAVAVSLI